MGRRTGPGLSLHQLWIILGESVQRVIPDNEEIAISRSTPAAQIVVWHSGRSLGADQTR